MNSWVRVTGYFIKIACFKYFFEQWKLMFVPNKAHAFACLSDSIPPSKIFFSSFGAQGYTWVVGVRKAVVNRECAMRTEIGPLHVKGG